MPDEGDMNGRAFRPRAPLLGTEPSPRTDTDPQASGLTSLTSERARPVAISFGETVIDVYPERRVVAGSPLHLAAHLVALGWSVSLVTRVGRDGDAEEVLEVMRRSGIDGSWVEVDEKLPTGTVAVTFTESGHAFDIHGPAAWDALRGPAIPPPCEVLCYGSLIGRSTIARGALLRLLDSGVGSLRVFDVNLRAPDIDAATVRAAAAAAHVVKVSDEELWELASILEVGARPKELLERYPFMKWVAISRGSRGAELWHRSGRAWHRSAKPVEVVDTVGAGDAFTSGLVDGIWRGLDGEKVLERATTTAESVLMQRGGLPRAGSP